MNRRRILILSLIGSGLGSLVALSQAQAQTRSIDALLPDPETIKARAKNLALTPEQIASMERLYEAGKARYEELRENVDREKEALAKLLRAYPLDEAAIMVQAPVLLKAEDEVKLLKFQTYLRINRVLDVAQRRKLLAAPSLPKVSRLESKVREVQALAKEAIRRGGPSAEIDRRLKSIEALVRQGRRGEAERELQRAANDLRLLLKRAETPKESASSVPREVRKRLEKALGPIRKKAAAAQRKGDHEALAEYLRRAREVYGEWAGVAEISEGPFRVPERRALSGADRRRAFAPMLAKIKRQKWWRIGEDPARAEQLPRAVASVIVGCLAARRAGCGDAEEILALAKDGADYLLWTQQQGELGLYPFPASEVGRGKVLGIAKRAKKRAQQTGRSKEVLRNGWFVEDEDLEPGGLQIDNGLCGVAILELYRETREKVYLDSALKAARWAARRPPVLNWNYNTHGIELLAEAFRETGDEDFLKAAVKSATIGALPGQLTDGPRAGRWLDGHNARANYHYIIVRGLVRLVSVLPAGHPFSKDLHKSLRLAFMARNKDFLDGVLPNIESALDALLVALDVLGKDHPILAGTDSKKAIEALGNFCISGMRRNRFPTGPGAWGRFLEFLAKAP